jgi:hypothetical protein
MAVQGLLLLAVLETRSEWDCSHAVSKQQQRLLAAAAAPVAASANRVGPAAGSAGNLQRTGLQEGTHLATRSLREGLDGSCTPGAD